MTAEELEHPLDHTTARIITELAAALLPHLKEAVSAELTNTIGSLPINVDKQAEEMLVSLKRVQTLFEDMIKSLNSARNSALQLSDDLLLLPRTCETLNAVTARLEQLTAMPDTSNAKSNELLLALEAGLSNWEGILKANGRAQTKELSEFSAEVSEQVGWMKTAIPRVVAEIMEKTRSAGAGERQTAVENIREFESKLTRLEKIAKIILAEGVVFILIAATIAAALYF